MRIKLLILASLLIIFDARPAFAVIEFNISNPQNNNNEVTIDVSITGLTSSSCLNGSCYLQAAFSSPSPIRYFGFTKNNKGEWYEYTGSPGSSNIQSTFFAFEPVGGIWSGQLTIKINSENPNYKGPGEYNLKAWRYSGKSDSYSGDSDNTLSINIEGPTIIPSPTPIPTPSPSPSPSPTPTRTPVRSPSPTPIPTPKKSTTITYTPSPTPNSTPKTTPSPTSNPTRNEISYRIASVAGAQTATPEGKVEVKDQKQSNPLIWIGLIFIFAGTSVVGYSIFKKNAKI